MTKDNSRSIRNYIRISLLLLIFPILYLGLWISISGSESMTYFEQVQYLMSYFPESVRNPFGITLTFFGMSVSSAAFGFYGYLKSEDGYSGVMSLVIFTAATLLAFWFAITLF
ncbi:MAG: hypothetical protein WD357_09150 [Gracilimonas sp.]